MKPNSISVPDADVVGGGTKGTVGKRSSACRRLVNAAPKDSLGLLVTKRGEVVKGSGEDGASGEILDAAMF